MSVKTRSLTVGTEATEITSTVTNYSVRGRRSNAGGYAYQIAVKPTAEVFVGGSDVTAENGWPVSAGEVHSFELFGDDRLYAITFSGTTTVKVFESGV